MGAIYRIWNSENNKSYIGQSHDPFERIVLHLSGKGSTQIAKDLVRYNPCVWNWQVVCDQKDYPGRSLEEIETRYFHQYNSVASGYNISAGPRRFRPLSLFPDSSHFQLIDDLGYGFNHRREEMLQLIIRYRAQRQMSEPRPGWRSRYSADVQNQAEEHRRVNAAQVRAEREAEYNNQHIEREQQEAQQRRQEQLRDETAPSQTPNQQSLQNTGDSDPGNVFAAIGCIAFLIFIIVISSQGC